MSSLFRMGSEKVPMKLNKFQIILDKAEREIFYPGEAVTGSVVVQTTQELKFRSIRIRFKGRAEVTSFIGDYDTEKETYFSMHMLLAGNLPTDEESSMITLPPGNYEYPFTFRLPFGVPNSFYIHGDEYGKVSYTLDAMIQRPGMINFHNRRVINVRSNFDIHSIPDHNNEVRVEASRMLTCLGFRLGEIQIQAHLLRKAYAVGEEIPIFGHFHNGSSRRVMRTEASLIQKVRMTVYGYEVQKRQKVCHIRHGQIPSGGSDQWVGEPLAIPEDLPPSGLVGCKLIDVQYCLELAVVPACVCSRDVMVTMDVIIGHYSLPIQISKHISCGGITSKATIRPTSAPTLPVTPEAVTVTEELHGTLV